MSRQSKQAKNAQRAKMFANGGPKSTTPKHGKKPENRVYTARCRSLEEYKDKNKPVRAVKSKSSKPKQGARAAA